MDFVKRKGYNVLKAEDKAQAKEVAAAHDDNFIQAGDDIEKLTAEKLAAASNLSDLADIATARANLGNVLTSTEVSNLIAAAGHLLASSNLSDLSDFAVARTNLDVIQRVAGAVAGNVPVLTADGQLIDSGSPPAAGAEIEVQEDGVTKVDPASILDFEGVTVTDDGGGKARITVGDPAVVEDVPLGGTPTEVNAFAQWKRFVIPESAFTDAATEETIVLAGIPGGTVIEGIKQKHNIAFSGGGLTGYTLEVGILGNTAKYSGPFDVFQAAGNTVQLHSKILEGEDHANLWSVHVTARSVGGNVVAATAGESEIWLLVSSTSPTGTGGPGEVEEVVFGGSLSLDARPKWKKVVVPESVFTAAAALETLTVAVLPAGGVLHAVKQKHTTAFAGGGLSGFTTEIGISGDEDKYGSAFDVFQAVGDTVMLHSDALNGENHGISTNLTITGRSTGANVVGATSGEVEIWLQVSGPLV